jgi:hypothetical protein
MQSNVNLYLSWSSIQQWAYLYESPKALWFDKVGGPSSGPVLTGDTLQIAIHLALNPGMTAFLRSRGLMDWTAQWSSPPDATYSWSIWKDANRTPGLTIDVTDTVYFMSQYPSYAGNYLIQYVPEYPTYLTTGPNTVPYQFQVRYEDGSTSAATSHRPPPPDTANP